MCAFLEGPGKHWGPHWFTLFRIAHKEKRRLYCVVNVPYARNFAKVRQAVFLIEQTLTNQKLHRMSEVYLWYIIREHIVQVSCLGQKKRDWT